MKFLEEGLLVWIHLDFFNNLGFPSLLRLLALFGFLLFGGLFQIGLFTFLPELTLLRQNMILPQFPALGCLDFFPDERLGVRVQFQHEAQILQWILLVNRIFPEFLLRSQMRLHLLGIYQATEIRIGNHGSWEAISNFFR